MSWIEEEYDGDSELKKFSYILNDKKIIKIFGKDESIWICSILSKNDSKNINKIVKRFPLQEKDLNIAKLKSLLKAKELGWEVNSVI